MHTNTIQNQRNSRRVPTNLTATATSAKHRMQVRIDNINRGGVYLHAPCYISVHTIVGLAVQLPGYEKMISMYLTTCFIEKVGAGYGVGAYISGISTEACLQWEGYYERLRQNYSASSEQVMHVRPYRVALLYRPLPVPALEALRDTGIEALEMNDAAEIERVMGGGGIDLLIADLNPACLDVLAGLRKRSRTRLPTRLLLLARHHRAEDFTVGLGLGAERVIGMPCSRELLVEQIMQTLYQRSQLRLSRSGQAAATSSGEVAVPGERVAESQAWSWSTISTSLRSAMRRLTGGPAQPKPQPA